jgi:hypothetical protein
MRRSCQLFWSFAALGVALALAGCSGSEDPVGGWKSPPSLFACFHADGTLGVGDHDDEATRVPTRLKWSDDGKITGEDIPPETTWKLDGDELVKGLGKETPVGLSLVGRF